jgi:trk system potassium uptake protein
MDFRLQAKKVRRYLRFVRALLLEQVPEKLMALIRGVLHIALKVGSFLIPLLITISLAIIVYTIGFKDFYQQQAQAYIAHGYILLLLSILFTIRFLIMLPDIKRWRSRFFNLALVVLVFYLRSLSENIPLLEAGSSELILEKILLFSGIALLFFTEVSYVLRFIYRRGLNPALLFVGSFAAFIVMGGFLLLLPNSTTEGISPIDAFFTAASAICVTGLLVVDTATAFTMTGKVIILMLIQLGGLGIMTFAGLIGFMVTGSVSIQNQIALRDMLSSSRMSNVITFISRVVIVTITFEAIGAFMIYSSIQEGMFESEGQKIFFSVFHAISAFCNAGMSTLPDGLYDGRVRFNYNLHWVIGLLVVLGGMGFPVVFNIFTYLRIKVANTVKTLLRDPNRESYTNILQTTSKLALSTYFILMLGGFVTFFLFEYNGALHEHSSLYGKITTSFFSGTATPRTAGFNTVDITMLSLPTVMIYLLLMYIGASPGSTGGGIKTTVAAVAFLNMKSIVLGHERTEAYRSEISGASVRRAFAIILLSLLVLGISVLLLSIYDSELGLFNLAFEAFAAFSTAGMALGVTAQLSVFGKLVVMATFFIGRMGALTLLFAVVTKSGERPYRYPSENIMY